MRDPAVTAQVAARLPIDLIEQIDREAKAQTRTRSNLIVHLLRQALADNGREQARTDVR